ncbi:MAG: hypothetical protein AAF907_03605 [Planctomycetota bacterium]
MSRFTSRSAGSFVAALLWFAAGSAAAQSPVVAPPTPVPAAAPTGGAGLFVGVNEFTDPSGKVGNLRFAVNDAVEQCHLFCLELRLLPPKNCTLALSGEPEGETATAHLAALKAAGVTVVEARKAPLFDALSATCAKATADTDLLIVACSSHGFADGETAYLMPQDGRFEFLDDTAVRLSSVESRVRRSSAGHRLLLVDACQNRVSGTKSVTGAVAAMSPAFAAAMSEPTGQVKIASCDVGQFSLELPSLKQGVFTAALLEALRGGAADTDGDGLIRLNEFEPAMTARVAGYLADYNRNLPEEQRVQQSPTFHGPAVARKLPLAVPATDADILAVRLAKRIGRHGYTAELHERVSAALMKGALEPDLQREAERFAELGGRFFAVIADRELPTVARTPLPTRPRTHIPPPRVLRGHTREIWDIAITPKTGEAISVAFDGSLRIWNLATGKCTDSFQHPGSEYLKTVTILPNGSDFIVGGSGDLTVWSLRSQRLVRTIQGHKGSVYSIELSKDGRLALSGGRDGKIHVWDISAGKSLRTFKSDAWEEANTGGQPRIIAKVAVTPNGKRAVSSLWGPGTLKLWDVATGTCLQTMEGHESDVPALAITPDGRKLVSGSNDETLKIWDLQSGRCVQTLVGHQGCIFTVIVTPDGRWIVSGSDDNTLKVWDLMTGVCVRTLRGHTDRVKTLAVTPDGQRIISGSYDATLRVWDVFEPVK